MKIEKKKKKNDGSVFHNDFILKDTVIKGTMNSSNDMRIEGIVEGNITAREGRVVIGETAKITGDIKGKDIDVAGEIKGNIEAEQLIYIKKTANIIGNLYSHRIIIEEGAIYKGACTIGDHHMNKEKKIGLSDTKISS